MKNSFKNTVEVTRNSYKDEGDGVVSFPEGLIITDNQIQRNGTRYDIESLDITHYAGQLTADHEDKLKNILGRVEGVKKNKSTVTVNKIVYAVKQNPYARLAYDLLVGGFSKAFSTETIGPSVDPSDNTHYGHELVGLSQVVTPNNYSAIINTVKNSLKQAQEDGLDVSELETKFLTKEEEQTMDDETKKPVVEEPVKVENEISDEQVLQLFEKLDAIEKLISEKEEEEVVEEEVAEEELIEDETPEFTEATEEEEKKKENMMTKEEVKNAIQEAISGLVSNSAEAPKFTEGKKEVVNSFKDLSARQLFEKQVNAAIDAETIGSAEARQTLAEINQYNLNGLKEAGIVRNTMTLASMGNFVISPEQYEQIVGTRTNYSALIDATNWKEIDTLEYVWATRTGDIDMKNVALCDDSDKNLKPISEYGAGLNKEQMEEMSAVTPVCDNATRFFVANLMEDVAAGYRNDYDRKRAQLVIAKLEQATLANKKDIAFTATESDDFVVSFIDAMATLSEQNGTLVFSQRTLSQLKKHAVKAGVNGPLAEILTNGDIPTIFGTPFIVVPNDLMPALDSEETVSITVNGKAVSITHAVFYADLNEFVGFTNEGLRYEIGNGVAYETSAGVVKSGFSRGETVLRGSFYRGGAFRDITKATGILRKGLVKAG